MQSETCQCWSRTENVQDPLEMCLYMPLKSPEGLSLTCKLNYLSSGIKKIMMVDKKRWSEQLRITPEISLWSHVLSWAWVQFHLWVYKLSAPEWQDWNPKADYQRPAYLNENWHWMTFNVKYKINSEEEKIIGSNLHLNSIFCNPYIICQPSKVLLERIPIWIFYPTSKHTQYLLNWRKISLEFLLNIS